MPVIIHVYFQKALPAVVLRPIVLYAVNTLADLSNSGRGSSECHPRPVQRGWREVTWRGLEKQNPLRRTTGNFHVVLKAQEVPIINKYLKGVVFWTTKLKYPGLSVTGDKWGESSVLFDLALLMCSSEQQRRPHLGFCLKCNSKPHLKSTESESLGW